MRILLVVPWDDAVGGVSHVAGNLGRYLQSRGHEIVFVFPGKSIVIQPKVTKFGLPGFELRMQAPLGERHPVISLSAFILLFPITLFQVIRLVWTYRIDVVNIHFPIECFLYFAVCRWIFHTVLVSSIHGADIFPGGKPRSKDAWTLKLLLRASNLVVAPSKQYRNYFLSAFPVLARKTTFIHSGIDLARFEDPSQKPHERHYARYVLCVSACKEQKALDVLIRAFKSVHEAFPLLNLVLVGDGPLRGPLETLARSLDLNERIEFLGYKTPAEVTKLLFGCDIFVLPSRFETFGIAILEAMACKKPVIATTAGGIPEIIENGKNGILVEPDNPDALAEALVTVLKNQTIQRVIASNGYLTVQERFRYENTGVSYEAIFGELLNSLQSKASS
jgi:glycosyltransferase involved in cell wall biosynthesis